MLTERTSRTYEILTSSYTNSRNPLNKNDKQEESTLQQPYFTESLANDALRILVKLCMKCVNVLDRKTHENLIQY